MSKLPPLESEITLSVDDLIDLLLDTFLFDLYVGLDEGDDTFEAIPPPPSERPSLPLLLEEAALGLFLQEISLKTSRYVQISSKLIFVLIIMNMFKRE